MPLTKEQKQKIVENLEKKVEKQKAIIFADFTGLKMKDLSNLRKKLKETESELQVVKKTLMGLVFKKVGLEIDTKELKGEIAFIFGYKDEISLSKTIYEFTKTSPNLKILGGFFEKRSIETEEIITLAKLPAREELLANLVGSISSPISGLINTLQGNLRNLVYIFSQLKGQLK